MPEAILTAAVREAVMNNPAGDPDSVADSVVLKLGAAWIGISLREQRAALTARIARLQAKMPDPRQLDLPGFEHIPASILEDTLEKYDADTAALEIKIRDYRYPRRSDAKLKADIQQLRERKRLRKHVAPLLSRARGMAMGQAIELYRMQLEKPMAQKGRKAIKARWDRKKGRTQNQ
jgi:hypothetical protein